MSTIGVLPFQNGRNCLDKQEKCHGCHVVVLAYGLDVWVVRAYGLCRASEKVESWFVSVFQGRWLLYLLMVVSNAEAVTRVCCANLERRFRKRLRSSTSPFSYKQQVSMSGVGPPTRKARSSVGGSGATPF